MWTYIDWIDGGFNELGQIATSAIHAPTGEFRAIRLTPPGPGETYYAIDDLGADPMEQQRIAHAIDNFGNVTGCSGNPFYDLAYVNSPIYGFKYLNAAPSATGGYNAYEIDDSGAIVGKVWFGQSGGNRAVHWTDDSATPSLIPYIALGAGGKAFGSALDTSSDGWVVGYSSAGKSGPNTILRAFRFKVGTGTLTNLGTLGGSSYATSINDHHEVVGFCLNNSVYTLYYYSDATGMINLWNNITNLPAGVSLGQPGLLNSPDNNNLKQILVPVQLSNGTTRAAILTPNQ